MAISKLEQLKRFTTVVADTGDLSAIAELKPQDATTNPSLLLKAASLPQYKDSLAAALDGSAGDVGMACDRFAVAVGSQIAQLIPGRISTEVDARFSFDKDVTLARAYRLVELYDRAGIGKERILIKIASTWQGIQAARQLEVEGIQTNLTLIFSFAQALACADAGVFLISPFVGRIYDWYRHNEGGDYQGADDPGVVSVKKIFNYYKSAGYSTVVMGASFRNLNQIEQLAGCDRLTISPDLLRQLALDEGHLQRCLFQTPKVETGRSITQAEFLWQHNEDTMATEKLAEGIRYFARDQEKLEALLTVHN